MLPWWWTELQKIEHYINAYKQKHSETEGMWEIKGYCMYYSLLPLVTKSVCPWPQRINTTFDFPKIVHNHSIQPYRNVNYQYLNLNTQTHSKINKSVKMQCCDHKNIHSQSSVCLSALGILKWLSSCLCQNRTQMERLESLGRWQTEGLQLEGNTHSAGSLKGLTQFHIKMSENVKWETNVYSLLKLDYITLNGLNSAPHMKFQ